ncbi:hypothetical protein COLO4_25583 [Corchorus olitorius]|uniref:Malectin-like domain-containing protein n=1 Tax=Corchorus olitorius TaxID=93759 RepID=A0A1R3I1B4_9ROSI|nr:hypothetical protein COLO4_25583 [Corchorus olitorius]
MEQSSVPSTAQEPLPPDVDDVPFSTARLSHSEFTYSIPLTAGPKFVRFHFYPTSYQGFDDPSSTKAFFSVKAGHFTLLGNFSALLHAQGQPTVVKEFFVNINESQRLNITFTPSLDILDSYAFINGIEIVSMPLDLYHGSTVNEYGITFLGQSQGILYTLGNDSAMEKLYRVNIGGIRPITGREDTGMYRYWEDDSNYLVMEYPRPALPFNYSIDLNFIKIPSYSAPREVYATARSMGPNKTHNENYSLTWEFSVDSGFYYFVRLHFCEFQIEITMEGDRVFEILIANLTAATPADVIAWSGGRGIPIYRDYVVAIGAKGNLKQQNLSIALHPAPAWRTLYSDAILNGIEIFKISHANFNLAGPNPDPIPNRLENMKPPIGESGKNKPPIGQSDWAKHCYDNGTLDQTIDPYLEGKISTQSLLKFGEVAINCLAAEGSKRPAMSEVVCGLELALQLQEINEVNPISDESHLHDSTVNDYHVLFTSGSGSMNVGR